jgi:hypothetical protein
LFSLLLFVVPAFADPVNVQLTGVGGANQGGVYVTPYLLSINGGTPINVICNDYSHDVWIGETWTANISTFSNLSGARFGTQDTQQYDEAAWLYNQYLTGQSGYSAGDVNFAIWALFNPAVIGGAGWDSNAMTLLSNAGNWFNQTNGQGFNYSSFFIITPTDSSLGSAQEYIAATPEPGSLVLMSSGLLLLALFARKKFRSTAQVSAAS